MKQLKDYLHFYLGCECLLEDKVRVTLNGFENNHPVVLNKKDWQSARVNQMDLIKPILRPLSDMTQDEADVIWGILDWNERITGVARITDIIREFDVIEEDNDTTSNAHWGYLCKILPYILKYGFDLFGLHEAGLCVYKEDLK